jgi:hypothetical protein
VQFDSASLPIVPATSSAALPADLIDLLRQWLRNGLEPTAVPIAFLIAPSIRSISGERIRLFHMPAARTLQPGALYICSHGLGEAVVPRPAAPTFEEWSAAIDSLGVGLLPAVVYSHADRRFSWFPLGLDNADTRFDELLIVDDGRPVERRSLFDLLNRLHQTHWVTPTAGGRHWQDSDRLVPAENAERVFQEHVLIACKLEFIHHRTFAEVTGPAGRCDVVLMPITDLTGFQERAVIEMKVVKDFSFAPPGATAHPIATSRNKAAVRKGISQALTYAHDNGCGVKIVCVCDMRGRDDGTLLSPYLSFATRHQIDIRRYFLFNSADAFRQQVAREDGLPA